MHFLVINYFNEVGAMDEKAKGNCFRKSSYVLKMLALSGINAVRSSHSNKGTNTRNKEKSCHTLTLIEKYVKLREHLTQGMLTIILCRIFCLQFAIQKCKD
jgi:hypothetical protein